MSGWKIPRTFLHYKILYVIHKILFTAMVLNLIVQGALKNTRSSLKNTRNKQGPSTR